MSRSTRTKRRPTQRRDAPAPFQRELMQHGWCRRDAEHLAVVDLGVTTAENLVDEDDALRVLAKDVSTALEWEPVYVGAQALYTDEQHQKAWRRLAAVSPDELARIRMQHLAALASGKQVLSVPPDQLGEVMSDADLNMMEAARLAEAAGDFARAADMLRNSVRPVDDPWLSDLEYLAAHGDAMSPARWGRWICSAALRWCLATPHGLDAAQRYAVICFDALGAPPEMIRAHTLERAVQDQVVHDVLLFDDGALAAFIETQLAERVADRVPRLHEWPQAGPVVVRLERRDEHGLAVCRNLVTDETVVVGDERLADEHPSGRCFYGRLVFVDGDDIAYFATKPTIVESGVEDFVGALAADAPAEARLAEMHRHHPDARGA